MTSLAAPSASTSSVDTSALKRPTQQFGQDQFLTMMLAQLKNQDPLKPLEPSEFLGQLAQDGVADGLHRHAADLGAEERRLTHLGPQAGDDAAELGGVFHRPSGSPR